MIAGSKDVLDGVNAGGNAASHSGKASAGPGVQLGQTRLPLLDTTPNTPSVSVPGGVIRPKCGSVLHEC